MSGDQADHDKYFNEDEPTMAKNDGGPAFPVVIRGGAHEHQHIDCGLTKRELFAAMAMQGNLVAYKREDWATATVYADSVRDADNLLAALEKK